MKPYNLFINHSRLLSVPLLSSVLYYIEIFLFKNSMTSKVWLSRRKNVLKDKLIILLNNSSKRIVCRSFKLQTELEKIDSEIVLDLELKNINKLSSEEIYQIMWCVTKSAVVTERTKKSLKEILPNDIEVQKTIVIPYNDSFEVVCDYIFQTAKTLSNLGNIVYLIAVADPESIFVPFSKKVVKNLARNEFFIKNKINVIFPYSFFPKRFNKNKVVNILNNLLNQTSIVTIVKHLNPDYLWCFDPVDVGIVSRLKGKVKTIYDCVDYFSSLDKNIDKDIKLKETQLIKSVDHFFVNSFALGKIKGQIRKPDDVVVQGFDLKSLSETNKPDHGETVDLENTKRIFSDIPRPIVGFVGTLTYRFDFKLLFTLIKSLPTVSFVFTDAFLPFPNDDRFVDTSKLLEQIRVMKNVYFVPKTSYRSVIKEILNNFSIGIIPYNTSYDFNYYCYPMKLFEYFYVGLPVISTPILELKRFPSLVKVGKTHQEWKKHIDTFLAKSWPKHKKIEQMQIAMNNSWENKINKILLKLK